MRRARNGLAGALKTTVRAPASSKKPDQAAMCNLWEAKPAFGEFIARTRPATPTTTVEIARFNPTTAANRVDG